MDHMTSESQSAAESSDLHDQASELFLRRRDSSWAPADQIELDARLARDPSFAGAFRRAQESWDAVGRHATSPELLALREQAIARARQASARRWSLPGACFMELGQMGRRCGHSYCMRDYLAALSLRLRTRIL